MKVVNLRKAKHTIYIGRGSIFGNPFVMGRDGGRKQVIEKYEKYLVNNKKVLDAIYNLSKDAILGCFCSPLDCHGSIIIKIWKELHNELE